MIDIDSLPIKRQIGKTTVLDDISLTYQALGYFVLLWTPFNDQHNANKLIRYMYDCDLRYTPVTFVGSKDSREKMLCIVDEVNLINSYENIRIKEYLEALNVRLVGFYR